MKQIFRCIIIGIIFFSCTKEETSSNTGLERKVDSLVRPYLDSAKVAGIAVGVFRENKNVLLKSYGFADLEFDVDLPVNASFEIGSVTKQFTAAATLQLVEQGKLGLDDDVTKYVSFDTRGKQVTIRQLLSHTSGIKGYTELPVFWKISMNKHKRDTLLQLVEKEPFDFDPGEALIYNNTGFFMLGLVIEKISGLSYEDYVKQNLFEKAGMANSYYCNESKVTKNRAHGYDMGEKGLVRAAYLDHTWPYAAGSLCSTVEDLVKWNDALHHGRILSAKMYEEFITPVSLNDGTVTHYAKGVTVTEQNGKRKIEHGGGINGFLSQNSYFPEENLSIIVLTNTTGPFSPNVLANEIAAFMIGKPADERKKFNGDLSRFAGIYKGRGRGEDLVLTVTANDSSILIQTGDNKPRALNYAEADTWNEGSATYRFSGMDNSLTELRVDQTYGYYILKKETKE